MQLRRAAVAVVVVTGVLAGAACAGGGSGRASVRTHDLPAGADAVVFRVDTRGGFTPVEYQLAIVAQLTVYGDGRVIVTGPVTEQYPPHALPTLLTGTLPPGETTRLAALAAELGLLEPLDVGTPGISDLPTTTVTIAVDGPHEHDAYALDVGSADAPGLTAPQRDARTRLTRFTRAVEKAASGVADEPYLASEVAVYARPAPADATDDLAVAPDHADWPLPGSLATIGAPWPDQPGADPVYRCAVLTGSDAATALTAATAATAITRWRSAGAEYVVVFRPLLPDEHTCP